MSNIENGKIVEQLLEQIEELGGDVAPLYEENDIAQMSAIELIDLLRGYIEELKD
jgi:hypothetical protein